MAKMINVTCPACKTINTMEKGFILWKNNTCVGCGRKLSAGDADDGRRVIVCASCKQQVAWDPSRGDECPNCGKSLALQQSERAISCPNCSAVVRYQENDAGEASCPNCAHRFSPLEQRRKLESILTSRTTDIQMPAGAMKPGYLFWHYPNSLFAVDARVVTAPGTMAVLVQGSTVVAVADGQSVRLNETSLKNDAWSYDGATVQFVNVDVYYVRMKFSREFLFGGLVTLQMPYNRAAKVRYFGTCAVCEVTDPAAFLRWVGIDRCESVTEEQFGMLVRPDGGREICELSGRIREEVLLKVVDRAMLNICAAYNIQADRLDQYGTQVMAQIEQLTNEQLADAGLRVTVSANGQVNKPEVEDYVDNPIVPGLAGAINWETGPVVVHIAGQVMSTATLKVGGSLYITVSDADALNRSPSASLWRRDPNAAREAIRSHISTALTARFTAVIQQIIEQYKPALHMLSMFNGLIMSQAALLLNQQGEFLQRNGLFASDLTVDIRIMNKSVNFELAEKSAALPDELALREQIRNLEREFATRDFIRDKEDELQRVQAANQITGAMLVSNADLEDVKSDIEIRGMRKEAEKQRVRQQLEQDKAMQELSNKHQLDETIRRYSYEAWRDQQMLAEQQLAAEMNRERVMQQHQHATQKANAVQEADLERLAQEVGLSKLSFREKMDAYARIQRNLAFQDQVDQNVVSSHAQADNDAYAAGVALKLSENSRKVMQTLDYEQKLHDEELQKARFAREMEQRRQELAEEMSRLNAEFERERAMAAEAEQRRKSENEVETLKLMLEFLAKDSENQVTAARMQAAREQAERSWQQQHAETERQQAAARRQEQHAAEQQMADRAYELVQQLNGMQHELDKMKLENERAYNQGRAMVDASGPKYQQNQVDMLKAQMENLQNAVKALGTQVAQTGPLSGFGKAVAGVVDHVRNAFTGGPAAPMQTSAPAYGQPSYGQSAYGQPAYGQSPYAANGMGQGMQPGMQGMNVCGSCGTPYSVGLGVCPNCGKR